MSPRMIRPAVVVALAALAGGTAAAGAHTSGSGAVAFARPEVKSLKCGTGDRKACPRGQALRLSGEHLRETRTVVFLGGKGRRDDRRVRPTERSPHRVLVEVPRSARTGRVKVITAHASARGPRLRVLRQPPQPRQAQPDPAVAGREGVFPVRGAHDYGTATNRFGGGRGHQGQDVFAKCGTPLVAALSGTVQWVKWHDRAGHYVVIGAADGTSQAYMHLQRASTLKRGQRIAAGEEIGRVGDTGRATGCHLHFELWTAFGWYEGGKPIDPLPALERWDAAS